MELRPLLGEGGSRPPTPAPEVKNPLRMYSSREYYTIIGTCPQRQDINP